MIYFKKSSRYAQACSSPVTVSQLFSNEYETIPFYEARLVALDETGTLAIATATPRSSNTIYTLPKYPKFVSSLQPHINSRSIAFGPDGMIAVGSLNGGGVWIWKSPLHPPVENIGLGLSVTSVAFAPDGILAAVTDNRVQTWNLYTREEKRLDTGYVKSVAFDGNSILAIGLVNGVQLWNPHTGRDVGFFNTNGTVFSVAFGPNDVLAAATGGGVKIWDYLTGMPIPNPFEQTPSESLAYSHDGILAVAGDGEVLLWDSATDQTQTLNLERPQPILSIALGGQFLAAATPLRVLIWEREPRKPVIPVKRPTWEHYG